jgi:uncharacterized protein (DUF885 family)
MFPTINPLSRPGSVGRSPTGTSISRSLVSSRSSLGDPETAAITEVERYCVWPGQACTYMLGKVTFLAQRARAQRVLGEKYDIRKFHDAMLLPGAMPLELLEHIYV